MAGDREATTSRDAWPAAALLVAGCVLIGVHASGLLGDLSSLTFIVLGVAAVASTIYGVRRWRPEPQWPWWTLVGALTLFLVGGSLRSALGTLGDLSPARPVWPDLVTLPGYVLLAVGFIGLVRARSRGRGADLDAVLDATIAGLAALALAWVFLLGPALRDQQIPTHIRLLLACYPPLSVFMVAVVIRLAFSGGAHPVVAFRLILGGMTAMLVGDAVYMLVDAGLVQVRPEFVDVPYALAYLLFSVAVLHPSLRFVPEPAALGARPVSRARLVLVAVALGVPGLIVLTRFDAGPDERLVLALIVLALTSAVALRMFRTLQHHARSEALLSHQITHDTLTGLPNRRYVEHDLAQAVAEADRAGVGVAVLFLDLDRFKNVNDTLGHGMGDELLVAVGRRLVGNVRGGDLVSRVGGDEFVVIARGVRDANHAIEIAERVRLGFGIPLHRARGRDPHVDQHRGRPAPPGRRTGRRRGDALERRWRHVPGQGCWRRRRHDVRRVDARPGRASPGGGAWARARGRARRDGGPLPARRAPPRRSGHRHGGAAALDEPRSRRGADPRSSSRSPRTRA